MLYNEYIPKKFEESIIHTNIIKKLKNIRTIDWSILLYGPTGSGKYILSQMVLENIFGMDIYTREETIITNGNKSFSIYSSNFHYEIYLKDTYIKYSELNRFIETLGKNRNIINNNKNVILIKNGEYLSKETLFIIKKYIEKQQLTFIILTNKLNSVFLDVTSFFMGIRVPRAESKEIIHLIKEIKKKEKIKILVKDIKGIISKNKSNIILCLYALNVYSITGSYESDNILYNKLDTILDMVYKKKCSDIIKIRTLLYNVCTHNINRYDILKYCFSKTLTKLDSTKSKLELLELTSEINNKLSHSFKNVIHIEYYLIKLMDFIE